MHVRDAAKNTVQIMGAPFLQRTNGSSNRNPAINFNPEDSHNPGVRNKSPACVSTRKSYNFIKGKKHSILIKKQNNAYTKRRLYSSE